MGNAASASRAVGVNVSAAPLPVPSSAIELGKRRIEGGEEFVGIALAEDQRRPDLDDVAEGAGIAGEEAAVLELVHDLDGAVGVRRQLAVVLHHLDADEQAVAAHVADRRARLLALRERRLEAGADARDVVAEAIAL